MLHFDMNFDPLHRFLILSTKRSGSNYLYQEIEGLVHWCDDWNFSGQVARRCRRNLPALPSSEMAIYKFHNFSTGITRLGNRYKGASFYYRFLERCIAQAEKVVVHQRTDAFDLALSSVIKELHRKETHPGDISTLSIDAVCFQNFYEETLLFLQLFNAWVDRNVAGVKRMDTFYADLLEDAEAVFRAIGAHFGLDLKVRGTPFVTTDFRHLANYQELRDVCFGWRRYVSVKKREPYRRERQ